MSGQTDTTHGETYTYTLKVCNVGGCNPTIATASATADKMVDGSPSATGMSVGPAASGNAWTVSWDVSVMHRRCWLEGLLADYTGTDTGAMPTTDCVDAGVLLQWM